MKFSANLGFLWRELSLPDAIRAAQGAGFDAVECHWPFDTDPKAIHEALFETGLAMISLNTRPGGSETGDFGLAALPGREQEARAAIDEALAFAAEIGAGHVHVMAGICNGDQAGECFMANLHYACTKAQPLGITVLIEPINGKDVPGYFLADTKQACDLISALGNNNLALMFDCYHVAITEGDVLKRLEACLPLVGHIQFASVPDRGPPGTGDTDFQNLFDGIMNLGYDKPLGAEYRVYGKTADTLDWLDRFRET